MRDPSLPSLLQIRETEATWRTRRSRDVARRRPSHVNTWATTAAPRGGVERGRKRRHVFSLTRLSGLLRGCTSHWHLPLTASLPSPPTPCSFPSLLLGCLALVTVPFSLNKSSIVTQSVHHRSTNFLPFFYPSFPLPFYIHTSICLCPGPSPFPSSSPPPPPHCRQSSRQPPHTR